MAGAPRLLLPSGAGGVGRSVLACLAGKLHLILGLVLLSGLEPPTY